MPYFDLHRERELSGCLRWRGTGATNTSPWLLGRPMAPRDPLRENFTRAKGLCEAVALGEAKVLCEQQPRWEIRKLEHSEWLEY